MFLEKIRINVRDKIDKNNFLDFYYEITSVLIYEVFCFKKRSFFIFIFSFINFKTNK